MGIYTAVHLVPTLGEQYVTMVPVNVKWALIRIKCHQSLALVSCRQTIASLQKLLGDLQKAQPQQSQLEQSSAEVVRFTCTLQILVVLS